MNWQWLENPARPARWGLLIRVALKALILFALVNLAYAALDPLDALGRVSVYNVLVPGTERIPLSYRTTGNGSAIAATSNIAALIRANRLAAPKAPDEFRVIVLGNSGTRASVILNQQIVTSRLNALNITLADGRRIVSYNLAYPYTVLLKDWLLLKGALQEQTHPDAVIWLMTLNSALPENLTAHPLVNDNVAKVSEWLPAPTVNFWDNLLIQQNRALADLLRLQVYGFTWAATRHDGGRVNPPHTIQNKPIDPNIISQSGMNQPAEFFTFEIIDAAYGLLGDVPLIIINEPMYRVDDPNNALILNTYYRRDVYEHYQRVIQQYADDQSWRYFDLWDAIPPEHFTNTPLHYDAEGARILAERLADIIPQVLAEESQ